MKVYLDVHNSKWKKYKIDFEKIMSQLDEEEKENE